MSREAHVRICGGRRLRCLRLPGDDDQKRQGSDRRTSSSRSTAVPQFRSTQLFRGAQLCAARFSSESPITADSRLIRRLGPNRSSDPIAPIRPDATITAMAHLEQQHEGGAPERLPAACEQGGQTCGPVCVL